MTVKITCFVYILKIEARDASPGRVPQKANIRTLALAIVPGQHIQSIAAAKLPSPTGDKGLVETPSSAAVKDYSQQENCSVAADKILHVTSNVD